jgi:hypothetical protein
VQTCYNHSNEGTGVEWLAIAWIVGEIAVVGFIILMAMR